MMKGQLPVLPLASTPGGRRQTGLPMSQWWPVLAHTQAFVSFIGEQAQAQRLQGTWEFYKLWMWGRGAVPKPIYMVKGPGCVAHSEG